MFFCPPLASARAQHCWPARTELSAAPRVGPSLWALRPVSKSTFRGVLMVIARALGDVSRKISIGQDTRVRQGSGVLRRGSTWYAGAREHAARAPAGHVSQPTKGAGL